MHLILQRLYISDYFRCRAVCRSWAATIDMAVASKLCRPSAQLPWLMYRTRGCEENNCFLSLSENQKIYKYSNPIYNMNKLDCVGSIEGWLMMVEHVCSSICNFFFNPMSGVKVMLPSQTTILCHNDNNQPFFLSKVTASSVPTNPNSCIVAAICSQGRRLAFCRPTDKSWTLIEADGIERVHDIEIIDEKLFATTTRVLASEEHLYVFHIHLDHANLVAEERHRHTYRVERLVMPDSWPEHTCSLHLSLTQKRDGVIYQTLSQLKFYLFKDSILKELFMISVHESYSHNDFDIYDTNFVIPLDGDRHKSEMFRVFKLEHSSNGPHRWVEVANLDGVLFLSKTTRLFIPISVTAGLDNQSGLAHDKCVLERNRIYFAFGRWNWQNVGVFSLADKNIQHYIIPEDHCPTRHTPPVWFTTSF